MAGAEEAPPGWVGRRPPVECNKEFGVCGYINCKAEGRCLQARTVKPPPKDAEA